MRGPVALPRNKIGKKLVFQNVQLSGDTWRIPPVVAAAAGAESVSSSDTPRKRAGERAADRPLRVGEDTQDIETERKRRVALHNRVCTICFFWLSELRVCSDGMLMLCVLRYLVERNRARTENRGIQCIPSRHETRGKNAVRTAGMGVGAGQKYTEGMSSFRNGGISCELCRSPENAGKTPRP